MSITSEDLSSDDEYIHYSNARYSKKKVPKTKKMCKTDDCNKLAKVNGYCRKCFGETCIQEGCTRLPKVGVHCIKHSKMLSKPSHNNIEEVYSTNRKSERLKSGNMRSKYHRRSSLDSFTNLDSDDEDETILYYAPEFFPLLTGVRIRKLCKTPACTKFAQTNNLCGRHGGKIFCQTPGCTNQSRTGGYCNKHGGGARCTAPTCMKVARVRGRCFTHLENRCTFPKCERQIVDTTSHCKVHLTPSEREAIENELPLSPSPSIIENVRLPPSPNIEDFLLDSPKLQHISSETLDLLLSEMDDDNYPENDFLDYSHSHSHSHSSLD